MPSSGLTSEEISSVWGNVVECLRGDGGRGKDVEVAMCSETRWSRDTASGFWFVGLGKRLTGDPEDEEGMMLDGILQLSCCWPVTALVTGLTGDLSRGLSRVTYVLDQGSWN